MLLNTVAAIHKKGIQDMAVAHAGGITILSGDLEKKVHLAVELWLIL